MEDTIEELRKDLANTQYAVLILAIIVAGIAGALIIT